MSSTRNPIPENGHGGGGGGGGEGGRDRDALVGKTAGLVVFSGIALSIIKTLISKPQPPLSYNHQQPPTPPSQPTQPPPPSVHPYGSVKNPQAKGFRAVEIAKGDTLWGISRKYGVSVDAIKEANGLKGDTIYAGKKLFVPS